MNWEIVFAIWGSACMAIGLLAICYAFLDQALSGPKTRAITGFGLLTAIIGSLFIGLAL